MSGPDTPCERGLFEDLVAARKATGNNRVVERRRGGRASESPMETLKQLPALVVLERIPVPILAIGEDGTILFSNTAFADMLGHTPEAVLALNFRQIFHTLPPGRSSRSRLMSPRFPWCAPTPISSSSWFIGTARWSGPG